MSVNDDRLHAEVDRQLSEIRAACDGIMVRSGLLISATGVGAAIVAARIGHVKAGLLGVLWALGIATVLGVVTMAPWLAIGPQPTYLQAWKSSGPSARSSSLLYDAKIVLLTANTNRLLVMRTFFAFQALAAVVAVGIALWYAAGK